MGSAKTNNQKVADLMAVQTGTPHANCYKCVFSRDLDPVHKFYRRCGVDVAVAITAMKKPLMDMVGDNSRQPLFPIIPIDLKDGTTEILPSIVAQEFGIASGTVFWPFTFDPLYILWCVFYTTKEEVDGGQADGSGTNDEA